MNQTIEQKRWDWRTVMNTGSRASAESEYQRRLANGEFAILSSPEIDPDNGAMRWQVVVGTLTGQGA